tara:strand:- start:189 stop:524 length:336 start_codon:yes stop_codon:yes gene_type:complete
MLYFKVINIDKMSKPKKISSLIPKIFKSFSKDSKLLELKANWDDVVGKQYSSRCYIHSLRKINKKNILTIESNASDLLELSYSSESLKKKINAYFSKEFVDVIKFKKSLQM